ncbi:MAG: FAD-dependent oxidoreductase [Anaerolineae bacterium]|nr:FAD-dependent oxidoreductase [Anaerolineae bacterium]
MTPSTQQAPTAMAHGVDVVEQTTCCIVGGGPGGAVLALLLARQGIPVTLLEAHRDFDRDFRGDTIHPSVMELLDEIGLAERLLLLPHTKVTSAMIQTSAGPATAVDFSRLKSKYPYITMLPQARFLDFIAQEASRYPSFRLVMGAAVREIVQENGAIRGVRYHGADGWHEVRALLTVAADGRSSTIRHILGLEPFQTSTPMDIVWFRFPRQPDDPQGAAGRFRRGHMLAMLNRGDQWQAAYIIPKGAYQQLRQAGIDALRQGLMDIVPDYADRLGGLTDWKQFALLTVESSRLPRWYLAGLLLIGDAAHVMSPVGGVGINYAIQDAVVAANVLSGPLKTGTVKVSDLAKVQRQREWPTRIMQRFQTLLQDRIVAGAFDPDKPFKLPWIVRLPWLRDLPLRFIAYGIWPVHLKVR